MKKMNIEYSATTLSTIINDIKNGEIKIPPFQRTFDWSGKDIARFYNSIVDGEPFGTIILWKDDSNKTEIKQTNPYFKALANGNESSTTKTYLIDGQQRTTTFVINYLLRNREKFPEAKYLSKAESIFFDMKSNRFYSGKVKQHSFMASNFFREDFDELWEEVNSLIDFKEYNFNQMKKYALLKDVYDRFNTVSVGKSMIITPSLDDVINVFTLINTKGKKLSAFNIVHAQFVSKKFDLDDHFSKIIKKFKDIGWGEFSKSHLLILAYSAMHETISNSEILTLTKDITGAQIDYIKNEFESDLEKLVHTMQGVLLFPTIDFVPSANIMNIMINILKNHTLTAVENEIIMRWVRLAIVNERYVSGSEGIKQPGYMKDLELLKDAIKDKKHIDKMQMTGKSWIENTDFEVDTIKYESYGSGSATYKFAMSAIIEYIPSLITGLKVQVKSIHKMKDLNIHHIFPKGHPNFSGNEFINSIANLTPLEKKENIEIGNNDPKRYIGELLQEKKISEKNLKKTSIKVELLDDFDEFIDDRSQLIASIINNNYGTS